MVVLILTNGGRSYRTTFLHIFPLSFQAKQEKKQEKHETFQRLET